MVNIPLLGSRKTGTRRRGLEVEWNVTNILIAIIISLILLQAFGLIFGTALGIDISLGPIFVLVAVGTAAFMGVAVFKKLISDMPVSKKDVFAIIIVTLIALLVMFFLRDLVPEIFEQGIVQIQSVIGI